MGAEELQFVVTKLCQFLSVSWPNVEMKGSFGLKVVSGHCVNDALQVVTSTLLIKFCQNAVTDIYLERIHLLKLLAWQAGLPVQD